MADGPPHRRIGAFPHIQLPLGWLTEGKLPPVCVYSGRPTGGHLERIEVDLLDLPPDAAPPSPGIRSLMGMRRLVVQIPMVPGSRAPVRRWLWITGLVFVLGTTLTLFAGTEFLGWRTGAVVASLAVMVVSGIVGCCLYTVRDFGILATADGTVKLRTPNRDAARAYRRALEAAGAAPPRACRRCGAASIGPDDGVGDDLHWYCTPCSREPASTGGPKNRPAWLLAPIALVIILFVLPFLVLRGALTRMFRGPAEFTAASALLAGIAAGIPFWTEDGNAIACGVAVGLTGAAALLSRGPGREATRKVVYWTIIVDLVAMVIVVSRTIAWM